MAEKGSGKPEAAASAAPCLPRASRVWLARAQGRHDPHLQRHGESVPVTVLDVGNNRVTQIRTAAIDGYARSS